MKTLYHGTPMLGAILQDAAVADLGEAKYILRPSIHGDRHVSFTESFDIARYFAMNGRDFEFTQPAVICIEVSDEELRRDFSKFTSEQFVDELTWEDEKEWAYMSDATGACYYVQPSAQVYDLDGVPMSAAQLEQVSSWFVQLIKCSPRVASSFILLDGWSGLRGRSNHEEK